MKTKWGSCNRETRHIWFNLELAKKHPLCLEYIVVHEMAHFLERTHGERFIKLMDSTCPTGAPPRSTERAPLGSGVLGWVSTGHGPTRPSSMPSWLSVLM